MPFVTFVTNIPDKDLPEDFNIQLSTVLADSLSKPLNRMAVHVTAGARITHGATNDPCAVIRSIGMVTGEENIQHSEKLTKFCGKVLNIPPSKVIIEYFNLTPETVGFNGTTVANASK